MLRHENDAQARRTIDGQHTRTPAQRRQVGQGLLIAGGTLVLVAFFIPWANLSKIPSGLVSGEGLYSPFVVVWKSIADGEFLPGLGVLLSFVVILACTVALIVRAPDVRRSKPLAQGTTALLIIYIMVNIVAIRSLPAAEMFYPYYDVAVELGAWVGLAGFLVEALGSLALAF